MADGDMERFVEVCSLTVLQAMLEIRSSPTVRAIAHCFIVLILTKLMVQKGVIVGPGIELPNAIHGVLMLRRCPR
jgi:hypothetical protein